MGKSSKAENLASQATFIFKGTVKKLKAATIPSVPVTEKTVVVKVDEILRAPEALEDFAGSDITVQLSNRETIKKGERAIFFTNSWMVGESLGVRSIGHTPFNTQSVLKASVAGEIKDEATQRLQEKVADADTVVTGKVTDVRLAGDQSQSISEHSPVWQEAVIEVSDVEKGEGTSKQILVRFPESTDVLWYETPKFQLGQEGVFLLKDEKKRPKRAARSVSASERKRPTTAAKVYTALDSEAIQPIQKVGTIRTLIKTAKG